MAFPSNMDADPDPTTQITWPSGRRSHRDVIQESPAVESPQVDRSGALTSTKPIDDVIPPGKRRLSTLDLIYLSISMGGTQVAWTVELGCVVRFFTDGTRMILNYGLFLCFFFGE